MLPRYLISAKEGFSIHQLPRMQLPLEEEGSFFCLSICFFMVLRMREGLTEESLREDLGCSSDIPDVHTPKSRSAVTTLRTRGGLGSEQRPFLPGATRERRCQSPGVPRRQSSFPGTENVMQMDFMP